ncbi:signal transduction histidine kinase [Sphingopyxis panaciterrae]|uniref:HAMP domain-containing sensor histidine kinase n=1 Tax=Sphingopyxis panaciterrae TaxID=363841 RepID=UPI001423F344|nr:HAMP domain-containing sensor histidine kinase [Sphingopyxis panaciterrae]NIJ36361.1 signal transduction histidine kinase [Sphingopyxis panaciterrae]
MSAPRRRVWRSLTLRLGVIYVALFLTSTAAMFGAAYWIGVYQPLLHETGSVRTEAGNLAAVDRAAGRDALLRALEARRASGPRRAFDALIAPDGKVLIANLPSWPDDPVPGWALLEADAYKGGQERDYEALVVEQRLDDGTRLIVGRDVEDIDDRDELFTIGSAWLIVVAAFLAIAGSFAMSAAVGQRIDAVTRTARRVMAGSLTERIPLRGTGDDFDELADALNLMLARIEESVESVRRVSDNVAHELRTPLARLHADLDELRTAESEAERQRLAEQAVNEAERLQSIFDALLRIARIESGRHLAGMKPVDLSTLLADAIEFHLPEAEARGQRIESRVAPGLVIEGDRHLIFQAVSNLLDNAGKYGGEGGTIGVTASAAGAGARIEISDTGPGIAPEYRERVKERFFRVPDTAGQPGTGLGLALVAAIVAFHKGRMEIGDAGPGAKVVLSF